MYTTELFSRPLEMWGVWLMCFGTSVQRQKCLNEGSCTGVNESHVKDECREILFIRKSPSLPSYVQIQEFFRRCGLPKVRD